MITAPLLTALKVSHGFCQPLDSHVDNVYRLKQVHGNTVLYVHSEKLALYAEGDGLVTDDPELKIGIPTADCLPVLAASSDGKFVGACHAGWRGLANNVVLNLLNELKKISGREAKDFYFAIGPSICNKHFIVKDDVLDAFKASFQAKNIMSAFTVFEDRWTADLQDLCTMQLQENCVEQIFNTNVCTFENGKWASYRRDKIFSRSNVSWISIKGHTPHP